MNLTSEEIEHYLLLIFTREKLEYIDNILFIFKQPDNRIKMKASIIYNKSLDSAKSEGLLTVPELENLIKERGFFTEKEEQKLSSLESKLEAQSVLLTKITRVGGDPNRIMKLISKLREDINELRYKKYSKLSLSAENKALDDKFAFMCSACTYNENYELYWKTYDNMLKETRIGLKNKALSSFSEYCVGLPNKVIRFIARHNLWRIRYISSCKTGDSLFGNSVSDYSNDQLSLAYWSNYYQNIYEMMPEDRPGDMIIDDDDSLDSYMNAYYEERTRQDASRKSKKKSYGNMSAFDKEEVIITKSNELYQDIKYNTPREAQKIKDRTDVKKRTKRGN